MKNITIIGFFWHHIRPYKWLYALMLLAPFVNGFYSFAYNYAIKLFLDIMTQTETPSWQDLLWPILLFMGTQFANFTVWTTGQVAELKSEPYVRRSILLQTYDYVTHHSYLFFQNTFTGAISSKVKGILDGYDKFWAEMHHGLMKNVFASFVGLIALSVVSVKLGVFVMIWSIAYVIIMSKISLRLNQLAFLETETRHDLIGRIADTITNILSLFAFSSRTKEYRDLDKKISKEFIPSQTAFYQCDIYFNLVGWFFYFILFFGVLFYMIFLKREGLITIGDFAFVFGVILVITEEIWRATICLQDFARAMGDLKSCFSILIAPQDNQDPEQARPLVIEKPSITFENVSFCYHDGQTVFSHLNLGIKPGEKIGLVGHSGAGKSTLVNLLLKYFQIQKGNIFISDQNIAEVTQDSLREQIALIPQDTLLFHRSLLDNIRYGRSNATDEEVMEASKKAHLHDFIMTLPEQYDTYVGERGVKLSGGQRQRISIARAILKDSPILILDEATSALDSQTEALIQESLNVLITHTKKTVIAVAHRLSTLKHMDRILVLDKGLIVEEGTHASLIQNKESLYSKLWELQAIG